MSDNEVLIRCENVSKKFCRDLKKSLWYGVKDSAAQFFGHGPLLGTSGISNVEIPCLRDGEFWANHEVSFELKRGECLGLIGRNGAGKTTLLKMLNGLIKPDTGHVEMRGRISALIALGAGFNPVLTGRENIYVNASVLGLSSSKIKDCIDDIVAFADLQDFIDTPVRNYSSGMQVRLGFAIATTLDPDVLLLDEVLAVGDAAFRNKCYHRMRSLMQTSAVIFVSHSMEYVVQSCSQVLLLRNGHGVFYPEAARGVSEYNRETEQSVANAGLDAESFKSMFSPITEATVVVNDTSVRYGKSMAVQAELKSSEDISDVILVFTAVNISGQMVMAWHTGRMPQILELRKGRTRLKFTIDPVLLHEGRYRWHFNLARRGQIEHLVWFNNAGTFTVSSNLRPVGDIPYLPLTSHLEVLNIEDGNSQLLGAQV